MTSGTPVTTQLKRWLVVTTALCLLSIALMATSLAVEWSTGYIFVSTKEQPTNYQYIDFMAQLFEVCFQGGECRDWYDICADVQTDYPAMQSLCNNVYGAGSIAATALAIVCLSMILRLLAMCCCRVGYGPVKRCSRSMSIAFHIGMEAGALVLSITTLVLWSAVNSQANTISYPSKNLDYARATVATGFSLFLTATVSIGCAAAVDFFVLRRFLKPAPPGEYEALLSAELPPPYYASGSSAPGLGAGVGMGSYQTIAAGGVSGGVGPAAGSSASASSHSYPGSFARSQPMAMPAAHSLAGSETPINTPHKDPMFCSSCGAPRGEKQGNALFCSFCGARFTDK